MDHNRDELSEMFDNMTPSEAKKLAKACGLLDDQPIAMDTIPRARLMQTRVKYLRAAFVGDVRLPFLVFVVLLAMFFSGWFVAQKYYLDLAIEREQRARADAYADASFQAQLQFNRLRDTNEENEAFQKFLDELVLALDKAREESGVDAGDQDQ